MPADLEEIRVYAYLYPMNKPWIGYLASALFLISGILYLTASKMWIGILFIFLALVNVAVNIFLYRKKK